MIGALFLDNSAVSRINGLRPAHFATEAHQAIFQAQLDCFEDGGVVDLTTVADRLERNGSSDKKQLVSYLAGMAANTPSTLRIERYAGLVREHWERRKLEQRLADFRDRAVRCDLAELRRDIRATLDGIESKEALRALDLAELARREPERPKEIMEGLPCGYASLSAGHGGAGKSTIEFTRAICIAADHPF